jgi:hypothetical protein
MSSGRPHGCAIQGRKTRPNGVKPRSVMFRCCGAADYSSHWGFNANGPAPRRAGRREKPNDLQTRRRHGKGAEPKRREHKPRPRHSNSNSRQSRRNPALGWEVGPRPLEALEGVERRSLPCPEAVPLELPRAPAWASGRALALGRGNRRLPPVVGQYRQVPGSRSHPRAPRPSRPMSKRDEIVFSYVIFNNYTLEKVPSRIRRAGNECFQRQFALRCV